ncbi:flagellar biosynthetic protein FliR [Arenibaculum pallidiluteum]|uniref:flagellar biosynthetic protein FliR n=1 Tax=Arenibaculum pallidiluteum TaxID=2812559 RepID=UPI001A96086E|nr:flagellar biosynthetic protein FliR [Arenibaculum pallidiluteum]
MDSLEALLSIEVYRSFLVFARVGAALMLMPGFGEVAVPARLRLAMGLVVSLALTPAVPALPVSVPAEGSALVAEIGGELVAGLFLGAAARLFLAALQVAGMLMGQAIGLANPFTPMGTGFEGGTVVSGALMIAGIAFVFAADIHYLMIEAILRSYARMPVGAAVETQALAHRFAELTASSFRLGVGFAAPFMAFGVIFNLALGLANRMLPNLAVFFVATPAMVLIGLTMLSATAIATIAGFGEALSGLLAAP